jgi:phage terminase large subunit
MRREIRRKLARPLAPLLQPARFKGAKGGRSGGKSHFFAEEMILKLVDDPDLRALSIREVQRSLKFSAKHLLEGKIKALGVADYFRVMNDEIRSTRGEGLIAFTGMQDHTADSLKSFEGFAIAWFEESHRMSKRSRDILIPTIRAPGSELWFSWNPQQPDDPIETLFRDLEGNENAILVEINYTDNPFCPQEAKDEAARMQRLDPDAYEHVWRGRYNSKNQAQVLGGKWRVDEFEPGPDWDGPYHGLDFGFSQDPLAATKSWIYDDRLWVEREAGGVGIELDDTAPVLRESIPGIEAFEVLADNARPECISHLRRPDRLPRIKAAKKWRGSVKDGIAFLRSFEEIVIHVRCVETQGEAVLYSHKVDRLSGQVLEEIVDAHNHYIDAIRYGLDKIIRRKGVVWGAVGSAR